MILYIPGFVAHHDFLGDLEWSIQRSIVGHNNYDAFTLTLKTSKFKIIEEMFQISHLTQELAEKLINKALNKMISATPEPVIIREPNHDST